MKTFGWQPTTRQNITDGRRHKWLLASRSAAGVSVGSWTTVRVHCVCVGCLGAWVYVVCNHIQGVNVMAVDGVGQWMWAVGEIGTGLGNVLGNRVVCLFRYPVSFSGRIP